MNLFIIGNGFDLEHELPTSFSEDFRRIAENNETISQFWEFYQSEVSNIWSDFEYSLGKPDFNSLEELLMQFRPDYTSEHESDRDAIIKVSEMSGNLKKTLYDFANQSEIAIESINALEKYQNLFDREDVFLTFNYTHTLEKLYFIQEKNVLHIHGENGRNNLELGYPLGTYSPNKYVYDPLQKGRGPYVKMDFSEYIELMYRDGILDDYIYAAFEMLIKKTKSFYKNSHLKELIQFLDNKSIDKVVVLGHSCKIDFEYFHLINHKYPNLEWEFNPFDDDTLENVENLIKNIKIKNCVIN